jgi:glyoxylase-like metal-dependent hydrolase (beta-lactamase superfamily II)
MQSWNVGETTLVRVGWFDFEVPRGDAVLHFTVSGIGVRTPGRRVVVDPWLAFDRNRAEDAWPPLADELRHADLAPEDVDTVVFTHIDGVGWSVGADGHTPTFPNARHLVPSGEVAAWRDGRRDNAEGLAALLDAGLVDDLTAASDLGPELSVEHTPGHTPNTHVVRIESNGDSAMLTGHLFLHPAQVASPEAADLDEDPPTTIANRRALLARAAADGSLLVGDLFEDPGAGRVLTDGDRWRYEPVA